MNTPTHKHKCDQCGFIWEHEDSCVNNTKAHTCKCGTEQWWVWHGKAKAAFISCARMAMDAMPKSIPSFSDFLARFSGNDLAT